MAKVENLPIVTTPPESLSHREADEANRMAIDPAWLKAELAKEKRSQAGLARYLGIATESVNRVCKGTRQIKMAEAEKIYEYLSLTAEPGATIPHTSPKVASTSLLQVRGTAEAGSWREVALREVQDPATLVAPQHLAEIGAYALRVEGPSMDRRYPPGSYVIVAPWHGGPLPYGKRVVVERTAQDGKIETTVKDLVRGMNGEPELWPRSSHPAHQTPLPYKTVDDIRIDVIGTVVGSYRDE